MFAVYSIDSEDNLQLFSRSAVQSLTDAEALALEESKVYRSVFVVLEVESSAEEVIIKPFYQRLKFQAVFIYGNRYAPNENIT